MGEQSAHDFVPAAPQLWTYDALSFLLTSTRRWRPALLAQVAPAPGDVIADIGCGTGTQLRLAARACSSATLIGIDPDAAVRQRARAKLAGVAPQVELLAGYARRRLIRRGVPIRTDTYLVGDHLIWGATARILADLFDRIGPLLKQRESGARLSPSRSAR